MNESKINRAAFSLKSLNVKPYIIIIALIAICIYFNFSTDGIFFSARNVSNIFRQVSVLTVISTGIFFVILSGHFDLSVGSLAGMIGGFVAIELAQPGSNLYVVLLLALILGALIGLLHGWLVAYIKVPAFIVTLGGYLAYRGILIAIINGTSITVTNESFSVIAQTYLNKGFGFALAILIATLVVLETIISDRMRKKSGLEQKSLASLVGKVFIYVALIIGVTIFLNTYSGIPYPVLLMLAFLFLFVFISNRTSFGRKIYAIGGNPQASAYSGINVKRNIMICFVISSLLAAVGGIILLSRINSATASAGQMYEMDAIAAVVIGGTSLSGGIGKVPGVLIGALMITAIDNGMSLMNLESYWQYVIKGIILVVAVTVDVITNKQASKN